MFWHVPRTRLVRCPTRFAWPPGTSARQTARKAGRAAVRRCATDFLFPPSGGENPWPAPRVWAGIFLPEAPVLARFPCIDSRAAPNDHTSSGKLVTSPDWLP